MLIRKKIIKSHKEKWHLPRTMLLLQVPVSKVARAHRHSGQCWSWEWCRCQSPRLSLQGCRDPFHAPCRPWDSFGSCIKQGLRHHCKVCLWWKSSHRLTSRSPISKLTLFLGIIFFKSLLGLFHWIVQTFWSIIRRRNVGTVSTWHSLENINSSSFKLG